jgi:hypothetical protein
MKKCFPLKELKKIKRGKLPLVVGDFLGYFALYNEYSCY